MRDGAGTGGDTRLPRQAPPARKSSLDIRALLTNRDYIKITTYLLPRGAKVRVLKMMEDLRAERRDRRLTAARPGASALPEMTAPELVREINWRVGTLPPRDAEAVAAYIRRLTRWRTTRSRRRSAGAAPPNRRDRVP